MNRNIAVLICREQAGHAGSASCETAGQLQLAPAVDGAFSEALPVALTSGAPRNLTYFVELKNRKGRSAGLSNPAVVLAGEAPAPITGLAAELRREGVVLRWNAADPDASIRLRRKLLTPAQSRPRAGPLPSTPEPIDQNFLVESKPGAALSQAIDKNIVFGNSYEYRAQRIVRKPVGTPVGSPGEVKTVELEGELSAPIRVDALDVFPPNTPVGLVAVATAADPDSATPASIDLSWHPNTEPDLAGYQVYRREDQTPWHRISGEQPVLGPSFHDAHVLPGHTYRYAVSAVDKQGHESGRSEEASETVPSQ